jgi:ubiquinone/menaquinone biosynthesis C-methylase UbiE
LLVLSFGSEEKVVRMMDAKEKSRVHFDEQALTYDTSAEFEHPRRLHPFILDALHTLSFASLLDLGCGTGIILAALAAEDPSCQLYGLDLSEGMLAIGRRRLGNRASLVLGDAENLPFANANFDAVCCSESFHHYPNPARAIAEVWRVLKPGGSFLLCDMRMPALLRPLINWTMPRFAKGGDVHAYSERELRALLAAAGFVDIRWQKIPANAFICVASGGQRGTVPLSCKEGQIT